MSIISDINDVGAAYGGLGGLKYIRKFGLNTDIDNAFEPIWSVGGAMTFQTAGVAAEIISSDAADNGTTATGALTVKVYGLDEAWKPKSETVTLNGTTKVALVNLYSFIYRMKVVTAGSGKTNAGIITARKVDGPVTMLQIPLGYSQTESTYFQIPANCEAIVKNVHITCGTVPNSSDISIRVIVFNSIGNVTSVKWEGRFADTASPYKIDSVITKLGPRDIVYIEGKSSVANFTLTASYDIYVTGPQDYATSLDM